MADFCRSCSIWAARELRCSDVTKYARSRLFPLFAGGAAAAGNAAGAGAVAPGADVVRPGTTGASVDALAGAGAGACTLIIALWAANANCFSLSHVQTAGDHLVRSATPRSVHGRGERVVSRHTYVFVRPIK